MKEIPCKGLEELEGTETYGRMLAYAEKYRKRAVLGSIVSVFFLPFAMLAVAIAYFFVFVFTTILGAMLGTVLIGVLGGLASDAVVNIVSGGIYWIAEAFIILPFLIVALVLLLLFYNSVKGIFAKRPNLARKLYLVDSLEEAERLTAHNKMSALVYQAFKYLWDGSLGRLEFLRMDAMSAKAYHDGAVISETEVKRMAFTAACSHPASSGSLRLEVGEHRGLVYMVVLLSAAGSADELPELIAVFDKSYKKEIIDKIVTCCPNTTVNEARG